VLTADEAVRLFGQLGLNLDYLISAERGANMPRVNLSPRSGDALSQVAYRMNGMSIFVLLRYSGYALGKMAARFRSSTVPQ
jgi:hypothetical protein